MKNVLFLTDAWEPFPTANVVCLQNVLGCLNHEKYKFFVNAFGISPHALSSSKEGVSLTTVKASVARTLFYQADYEKNLHQAQKKRKLAKIISNARRILYLPIYPKTWSLFERKWYEAVLSEVKEQKVDAVVSVVAPMEALWIGEKIKKTFPDIKWIVYLIDGGSDLNEGESYNFIKKRLQYMSMKKIRAVFRLADDIVIMYCHENHYKQIFFNEIACKLHMVDVPLLLAKKMTVKKEEISCDNSNCVENWVYAGNLDMHYYNPREICAFFHEYSKTKNAVLHFYGRGNGSEVLQDLMKQWNGEIIYHGLFHPIQLQEVYQNADVLVNYLSAPMSAVSGKFFEYIAYGKPVIYFAPVEKDVNTSYVERYSLGACLLPNETLDKKIEKVTLAIKKAQAEPIDVAMIRDEFWSSTPQANAKILELCLDKSSL